MRGIRIVVASWLLAAMSASTSGALPGGDPAVHTSSDTATPPFGSSLANTVSGAPQASAPQGIALTSGIALTP